MEIFKRTSAFLNIMKRGLLVLFMFLAKIQLEDSTTEAMVNLDGSFVDYGGYNGFLALPDGAGPFPAVLLIHEWWGLNDNIKSLAVDYAREGYVALAVDLYDGEVTAESSQARVLATGVRNNMDSAFSNLRAGVSYLKARDDVNDQLASIGWCFGGGWSYEMAKNDLGVDASVIYYGRFNPEDDLSRMRATILGHFGEEDTSILVDDVNALEVKLNTLSGDHQVFIYPNAGHAFANEGGSRYHEPSAQEAWDRTLEFLSRELN